jgi:hypothetical protein
MIIRKYQPNPDYPGSIGQIAIQQAFDQANTLWVNMDEDERKAWNDYAKSLKTRKPFGKSTLSGRLAFIMCLSFAIFLNTRFGYPEDIDTIAPKLEGFLNIPIIKVEPYTGGNTSGIQAHYENVSDKDILAYIQRSTFYTQARYKLDGPYPYDYGTIEASYANSPATIRFGFAADHAGEVLFIKHHFITLYAPFMKGPNMITRHIVNNP